MPVALVHDWLTGMRGGERVLEALVDLYPDCEIFTLVHRPGRVSSKIESRPIHTSFINWLPAAHSAYRYYLPLFPSAIERFDLRGFDLIISVSHCVAKGVRVPAGVPHLCYCLTPMRYVWDLFDTYFGPGRASPIVRAAAAAATPRLRRWDVATSQSVTRFVAISRHVQERIKRIYGRDADVVHPPVEIGRFTPAPRREDFFLTVSALVPYKRLDLMIEAFNRLGRRLTVVGEGSERSRLARRAGGNITLTGWLPDHEVADLLGRCRAFVYAAEEDFGIVLVEAQAAGAPVIAYGAGGAAEIVRDGRTGVLFRTQSVQGLMDAVARFEALAFDRSEMVRNAQRFGLEQFKQGLSDQMQQVTSGRALKRALGAFGGAP